jgi:hypothetical protein
MEKIRLDLDALAAESFPLAAVADDEPACGAVHTRDCATPLCTAGTSCL